MDESDPIEARTARLEALQETDPIAWAITQGKTGVGTISKFLRLNPTHVEAELERLRKAKEVRKVKYGRGYSYRAHSRELKRLARRAWAMRKEEAKKEYDFDEE
jgi:Mn-dependent DtxR family transcriptional regulator